MEQSSIDLTQNLSRASDEIGRATVMLKNQFREQQNINSSSNLNDKGVDPIEMVRRLQVLQRKIEDIQQVSHRLGQQREELVREIAVSLRENVNRVNGLERRADNVGIMAQQDEQAWIEGQHILNQCIRAKNE